MSGACLGMRWKDVLKRLNILSFSILSGGLGGENPLGEGNDGSFSTRHLFQKSYIGSMEDSQRNHSLRNTSEGSQKAIWLGKLVQRKLKSFKKGECIIVAYFFLTQNFASPFFLFPILGSELPFICTRLYFMHISARKVGRYFAWCGITCGVHILFTFLVMLMIA